MVAEIAYRCIILNGKLGTRAVVASPGVVLIDELDMHLHPRWQRHIVKDFKAAFPNMQFIVTTHSPFIVQSLESVDLINLDRVTDVKLKDLSIGEVSESVMGIANEMSEVNAHDERISQSYFETILNPATKTKQEVSSELDRLEMKISDPGVRALLKMKRLQKDI